MTNLRHFIARRAAFQKAKVGVGLIALGVIIGVIGVLTPSGVFRPPSQRTFLGPIAYDSRAVKASRPIPEIDLETGLASDFKLDLSFVISSRPETYAYLVSSEEANNQAFAVSIDNYGNCYLELPISNAGAPKAIIKLADSLPFQERQEVVLDYSGNFRQLSIRMNGSEVVPQSVNNQGLLVADQLLLVRQRLSLGGPTDHAFTGSARVQVSYGELRNSFDLRNFRMFLLLVGATLLIVGIYNGKSGSRKSTDLSDDTA